jgi:hypothetical protein
MLEFGIPLLIFKTLHLNIETGFYTLVKKLLLTGILLLVKKIV